MLQVSSGFIKIMRWMLDITLLWLDYFKVGDQLLLNREIGLGPEGLLNPSKRARCYHLRYEKALALW